MAPILYGPGGLERLSISYRRMDASIFWFEPFIGATRQIQRGPQSSARCKLSHRLSLLVARLAVALGPQDISKRRHRSMHLSETVIQGRKAEAHYVRLAKIDNDSTGN